MIQNKMCILWNLFELVSLSWNLEIGYVYEKIPTKKIHGNSSGVCLDALYCCDKYHEQATKGVKGLFLLTLPGKHLSLKEAKAGT